jgi:hypothetical protein
MDMIRTCVCGKSTISKKQTSSGPHRSSEPPSWPHQGSESGPWLFSSRNFNLMYQESIGLLGAGIWQQNSQETNGKADASRFTMEE